MIGQVTAGCAAHSSKQEKVYRSGSGVTDPKLVNQVRPRDDDFARGALRPGTPGLIEPKLRKQVAPRYTPDAMRARLQGTVVVEAVILEDGTVGRARIKESLDDRLGLDQAALDAVGQWAFEPGTFEGAPAPVLVTLKLELPW